MNGRMRLHLSATSFFVAAAVLAGMVFPALALAAVPNSAAPTSTVKLVFVHHSTGQAWLQDGYGNLAKTLGANHYFVSDTNYGWGPSGIGDHTDVGDWWTWFRGPSAGTYTTALYANTGIRSGYARTLAEPVGENTIIMFKSCFPNSAVGGPAGAAVPPIGSNPLRGNGMSDLTVANAKGVYLDLLEYFKLHPDKMFVLVVSPPLKSNATNSSQAANARTLANWLVDPNGLLKDYSAGNVFVFDYYTVLTGGHHRIVDGGLIDHSAGWTNYLKFPTGDSHPSATGDRIATAEFVPMLNAAYNSWKAGTGAQLAPTLTRRSATVSAPTPGKSRLSRKSTYTWRGAISPAQIGSGAMQLEVHRLVRGKWRGYATLSPSLRSGATTWSVRLRIKKAGTYRVRVRHSDGDHFYVASAYRKIKVR